MKNSAYPRKVLLLIFCVSLFNYIDRQVLYAVFPLLKADLRLSDAQLGFLASSFMIVYMCFAPFVGYFGDRVRRPLIVGVSAVFWSVATLFSGFIRNYAQLIFTRSAVGIGEAGYGTVSPSYLAEWFPKEQRGRIMALYALAIPVGSAIGYLLGGYLGQHFGWRNAFYIVAVPGALLGLAALFLIWGVQATLSPTGKLSGYPAFLYYMVSAFAAFFAALDLKVILQGGVSGVQRISRHLWRMCFALLDAAASFFIGPGQKMMPVWMHGAWYLYVLGLAPLAFMVFWLIRVRIGKRFKGAPALSPAE